MKYLRWLLVFALAAPALAQNTRFDLPITTVQAQGGNLLPVYAIPGAGVVFYSCSGSTCTTLATTYISATSATACPTSPTPMQITLNGSSTCVANADPYGNMGGWFLPGQYMATITAQGSSYNYLFTVGGGSTFTGCSSLSPGINCPQVQVSGLTNTNTGVTLAGAFPGAGGACGSGYAAATYTQSGGTCTTAPVILPQVTSSCVSPVIQNPGNCTVPPTITVTGNGTGATVLLALQPNSVVSNNSGLLGTQPIQGANAQAGTQSSTLNSVALNGAVVGPNPGGSGVMDSLEAFCGTSSLAPWLQGYSGTQLETVINSLCDGAYNAIGFRTTNGPFSSADAARIGPLNQGANSDNGIFQSSYFDQSTPLSGGWSFDPSFTSGGTTYSLFQPYGIDFYLTGSGQLSYGPGSGYCAAGPGYTGTGTCTLAGGTLLSGSPDTCSATTSGGNTVPALSGTGVYSVQPIANFSGFASGANYSCSTLIKTPPAVTGSIWMDVAGTTHISTAAHGVTGHDVLTVTSAGALTVASCTGCGATAGVSSLNTLTGALNITAGAGITITPSGSNIQVALTGGGGTVSGTGTGGVLPVWTGIGSSSTQGNSPIDYGNTIANTVTSTAPENINNAAFAPSFNFSYTNPGFELVGNNVISELINVNTSGSPIYIPGGKIQIGNTQMILLDAWQNATAGNCTQFQGVAGYPYVSGFTSTFTNGVTSITVSSSANLVVGMNIYGPGIATGATITVVNGTTITMSLATTAPETSVSLSANNGTGNDCAMSYAIYHDTNSAETCQGEVVQASSGSYTFHGAYNDAGGCSPTTTGGFGISLVGQDMDTTRFLISNCNGQPYWWQFFNSSLFTSVRFENFTMVGFGYLQDCGFIGIYGSEHIDIRHVHGFNSDNHPVDGILRTTSLGNYNSSGLFIGGGYENSILLYKQENPTNVSPAIVDAGNITFATDTLNAPSGYGSSITQPHPNAITAVTLSQTCDTTGTNWGTSNQPCNGKTLSSGQVARISPYYDLSSPTSSNQTVSIKYKNPPRIVATADGTAAGHIDPYNLRFTQVPNVDPLYARGTTAVSGSIIANSYQNACSTQPSWTSNFYALTNAYSTSASGFFIDQTYPVTIWPTLDGNVISYGFSGTYTSTGTTVTLTSGTTAGMTAGAGNFIFSSATGIPANDYIASITDSTHFVLNAAATVTQASPVGMSFANGTIIGTPAVQFAGSNLTRINLYGGGTINPSYAPYGITISLIGKTEPGSFGVQWLPATSTYSSSIPSIVSYGGLFYQANQVTIPAGTLPTNGSYWSAYTSGPATFTPSYSGGTLSGVTYATGSLSGFQANQYTYLSTQINVLDANGAIARSFLSKGPGSNCPPDINILLLDIVQQDYAISLNTPDSTYIDLISSAGGYTAIYGTSTSNFYHPHPYYNVIGMQLPGGTIKDMEDDTQYWRAMILGLGAGTAFASTDATHFINYNNWKNPTPNFFHNKSEYMILNQALITPGATLGNVSIQNDHCFDMQDEGNYHFLSGISGPADIGQGSPTTGLDFPQMTVTQGVSCAWNGQTFNYHTGNTTTSYSPAPTFLIPQTVVGVSYPTQTFTISGISTPAWAVASGGAPYGFANFSISPGFTGGIGGGTDTLGTYLPSTTIITLAGTPGAAGGNPSPQFEQTTIYDSNGYPHTQKFVMKGGLGGQITVGGTGVTCTNFACTVTATWTQGAYITPLAITPTCGGCTAPYHYYLTSGRLPPGLSLTGTGTYYGIPTLGGTYNWQVTTNDATSVPGATAGNISVTTWTATITGATVPSYVVTAASGPAAIGQIFTIGAAAGTSPTVPTCVLGYLCNDTAGTVSFTTGSATPTTGTVLTLNVAPNFNYNYSNCYAVATEQASPYTVNVLQATDTIQNNGLGQQIAFGVTGNTALVASQPYLVAYNGCSQN